jgi:putative sterol carrier protein
MDDMTVKEVFEAMPARFNPEAATGMDEAFQYCITGEGGGDYNVSIKDGACTVSEGIHDKPSVALTLAVEDFLGLISGKTSGMQLFMSGKVKVTGNVMLAQKMQTLFDNP